MEDVAMGNHDLTALWRSTIGFDRLFNLIDDSMRDTGDGNYLPYDIERTREDHYQISLVHRSAPRRAGRAQRSTCGILLNQHFQHDGPTVFAHACKLGLEGIVSKRKDSLLSLRPDARLAQVQEPRLAGSGARPKRIGR
jgi:hypothetical protein